MLWQNSEPDGANSHDEGIQPLSPCGSNSGQVFVVSPSSNRLTIGPEVKLYGFFYDIFLSFTR